MSIIKTIYEDEMTAVDVTDFGMVGVAIEAHGLTVTMVYDPDEAVAIGNALIAAGAEAGAQCCAEGCCEPATEFGPLHIVEDTLPGL